MVDPAHTTFRSVGFVGIVNSHFEVSRLSRLYVEGGACAGTQQRLTMKEAAFDIESTDRAVLFLAAMT